MSALTEEEESVLAAICTTAPGSLNETLASHLVLCHVFPRLGDRMGLRTVDTKVVVVHAPRYAAWLGVGVAVMEAMLAHNHWLSGYSYRSAELVDGDAGWKHYKLNNGSLYYVHRRHVFLEGDPRTTKFKRNAHGVLVYTVHMVMGVICPLGGWNTKVYLETP